MSIINQLFDQVFVINLDRSRDRLQRVSQNLNEAGVRWSRFRAIDGDTLSLSQKMQYFSKFQAIFRYPGIIGCAFSHIELWKYVVRNRIPRTLVFEDDVVVDGEKLLRLESLREWITTANWDLLYLYHMDKDKIVKFVLGQEIKDDPSPIIKPRHPLTTCAYAVTYEGAKRLLNLTKLVNNHIDQHLAKISRLINTYAINPNIVTTYYDNSTLCIDSKFPANLAKTLDRFVKPSEDMPFSLYNQLQRYNYRVKIFNTDKSFVWTTIGLISLYAGLLTGLTRVAWVYLLLFVIEIAHIDMNYISSLVLFIIGATISHLMVLAYKRGLKPILHLD